MERFFSVVSQHARAGHVIEDCLEQLDAAPADANFAFVYATDAMSIDFPDLLERCKQKTGIRHWVGTVGVGIIAGDREINDTPAVSIMLARFDPRDFTMLPLIKKARDIPGALDWPREFLTNFGIIHADPYNHDTQELIEGLYAELENGFFAGGLTSSNSYHYQVADEVYSDGISGVLFSENVGVLTNLSQGCSPVGAKHRITRCRDNVAFTLDDQPALDVLMTDMGFATVNELREQATDVFTGICIADSDLRDYTVRNLVGVDIESKVFAINDYLRDGSEMLFCARNAKTAVDDMQHMLESLAGRMCGKPKGGIYVSCLGRGRHQFGENSEEVGMIRQMLGDFPLIGFFANGEIHHNRIYGYTGVLTLFV